jgi:type I restriction enzyme M protein
MARTATAKKVVPFETELWNAAVQLRGNVAPADYKHFVLPLLFLRYLSLGYEKRREELVQVVREAKEKYGGDQMSMDSLLDDRDEYTRDNAYILPETARWDYIAKHAQRDDIKIVVDDALEAVSKEHPKLRDVLRRIYAGSNLDAEALRGLIALFSKDVFSRKSGQALDMLGKTYEYFIGNFASTEGARGGEYFTPESVVRVMVECMAPTAGIVFDPACGSGGMFVQSDKFAHHNKSLSFVGQERIDTTVRLAKMNLILHGLDGDIRLGNSLLDDRHSDLKADYVIANPPFNLSKWGADRLDPKDPRLVVDGKRYAVPNGNANYMWMLHYLHHLKAGGIALTVMANGSMTTNVKEEKDLRRAFVEAGLVDCVMQLPEKLFAQTGIPVCVWIFRKKASPGRSVFFIDARKLGALKEGSRKQKELSEEEIHRIASAYQRFRSTADPIAKADDLSAPGFCAPASLPQIEKHDFKLTPGIYVGSEADEDDGEAFEEKFTRLAATLEKQFKESAKLQELIRRHLAEVSGR